MLKVSQHSTHSTRPTDRSGLSLLELLVVLTILIALGGIVVSTLPGMLKRTQVATAASNIPEIDATIRRTSLLSQGIETRRVFYPLHLQPAFSEFAVPGESFVVSESIAARGLSLPTWPGLTFSDLKHVVESLGAAI